MRPRLMLLALSAAAIAPASGRADLIGSTNLIVTGNLTTGAEVQGRAIVGGTLVAGNASNYAFTNPSSYSGTNGLVVAGTISGGNQGDYKVMGGNALIGGETNNQVAVSSGTLTVNQAAASSIASQAASAITNLSNYYSGLSANSTVSSSTNGQPGPVVFTATAGAANGVAVFNVNASIFSSQYSQSYDLVANGDSTFVINVTGSSATFNAGNFLSGFSNNASKVIFNFTNATSIEVDRDVYGAILGTQAALHNTTAIDGSVFVSSFNQQGEVHLPNFTGYNPYASPSVAVPVPASAILLGLGLPGGLIARRIGARSRRG